MRTIPAKRALLFLAIAAALPAGAARADQLVAYGRRTFRSADGAWLLETEAVQDKMRYVLKSRDGKVRGRGEVDHLPVEAAVFADGGGFVLWGRYMREGRGIGVARYDPDGTRRWSHLYTKMFDDDERAAFPATLSFVFWAEDVWLDKRRGLVVGTTGNKSVRIFDLQTGEMRAGGMTIVLESLALEPPPLAAVETAAAWFPDRAAEPLGELARNEKLPRAIRVAALAAADRDERHVALVRDALDDPETAAAAVAAAERCLPPRDARDLLVRAATKESPNETLARNAVAALGRLGDIAGLVDVVAHGEARPEAKDDAVALLEPYPAAKLRKPVLAEFKDADLDTASRLLDVLIATGDENLARAMQPYQAKLIALLGRKGADVAWLADCFTRYPTTEAAKPLVQAARVHIAERKAIFDALRACTGLRIGDDLAAWARAVR